MPPVLEILLVEDSPTDALLAQVILGDGAQFEVIVVDRLGTALERG